MSRALRLRIAVAALAVCCAATLSAAEPAIGENAEAEAARFAAWTSAPHAIVEDGVALARDRSRALQRLMRTDPRRALGLALRHGERRMLHPRVREQLEQPVDAMGEIEELVEYRGDGSSGVRYNVVIAGQTYEAFLAGGRPIQRGRAIAIHGIRIGGSVAISGSPVRLLDPGEAADPRKRVVDQRCPVSGRAADPAITVDAGDVVYHLCDAGHVDALAGAVAASEAVAEPAVDLPWTTGTKTLLFMRIDCGDNAGDPVSVSEAQRCARELDAYIRACSYGRTSITMTIIPTTLHLPGSTADYVDINARRAAAYTAARAAGYEPDAYDREVVYSNNGAWGSCLGSVHNKGCWINLAAMQTWAVAHEQGHNLGVRHANSWEPTSADAVGAGSHLEYGDPFDVMGTCSLAPGGVLLGHHSAYSKHSFGWLPDANVAAPTADAVIRVTAHDTAFDAARTYAIRVDKDWQRTYWIDYRSLQDNGGPEIRWQPGIGQYLGTELLRPNGGRTLAVGATLVDDRRGVAFTTLAVDRSATPAYADVRVSFSAPANRAPSARITAFTPDPLRGAGPLPTSFTVSGSDPDGDYLRYTMDFGDGQSASVIGTGADPAPFTHTYVAAGTYHATLQVQDYGGLSGTAGVDVSVTSTSPYGSVQFSAPTFSTREGDSGITPVAITVVRTGGSAGPVSVTCATTGGGTADGADYVPASATLTWNDGDTAAKTFTVGVRGDRTYESDDTVRIALSSPTGGLAIGSPATAILTIADDDAPAQHGTVQFAASTAQVAEGDSGTTLATIAVSRTGGSSGAVQVAYATSDGTATAGSDYTATTGTLSWADGDSSLRMIAVAINGDTAVEGDETLALTLTAPTGGVALGAPASAVLTIVNDDVAPAGTLQFASQGLTVTEGAAGTTTRATIAVTRVGGSAGAVQVAYATSDGTATAGSDYVAASGTLAWADGDAATKTFTVAVTGDDVVEPDETVTLTLTAPTGGAALGAPASAVLTIANDDVAPAGTLQFASQGLTVTEGAAGTTTRATIAVTRVGGSAGAVQVAYATSDGTATAGSDYVAASGTLAWADGDAATKTFTVAVTGDDVVEPDETVTLTLTAPTGGAALGAPASAVLTIANDDVAPGGTGTGLLATYFSDVGLAHAALQRVDPGVDFDWGTGSPAPAIAGDGFSARWEGSVEAPVTGAVQFATVSDDGVRLWIDDRVVIDDWTDHGPTTDVATIALEAGRRYRVRMEYYEHVGGAVVRLLWQLPGQASTTVPATRLFPARATGVNGPGPVTGGMTSGPAHHGCGEGAALAAAALAAAFTRRRQR